MKKATTALQLVAGLSVLAFLAVAMFALLQYVAGQQATAPLAQATAPVGYPPPATRFPPTLTLPSGYPQPPATSTWSPAQFTAIAQTGEAFVATNVAEATQAATRIAEMTASAPSNPRIGPQTVYDLEGQYSLQLFEGWRAYVGGTTVIVNYDTSQQLDSHTYPPGGLKIQIGVGKLEEGQSFDAWLSHWRSISTSFDKLVPTLEATEPLPITVGAYGGVTYYIGDVRRVKEIVLPLPDGRIVIIGLTPAESPAMQEALSMLATLNALP
jgi:hypothetical protein